MPISQTDLLFSLIKSLTKAEKRNFTLFAKRIQGSDDLKFLQLFELIDRQSVLDEKVLLEKMKGVSKSQLSNVKRHLYKQILVSLRMIHLPKNISIQIREHMDYAEILYNRGLYKQSLKILNRANRMADSVGLEIMKLEILETQKLIESRHITRTGTSKNTALTVEAKEQIKSVSNNILLSNLRLRMHSWYINYGHIKSQEEYDEVQRFMEDNVPAFKIDELGFIEKIYLYQAFVWYYYTLVDFENCYQNALKWIDLFKENPSQINRDPDLMMRGYHYLLTSAFRLKDIKNFEKYLEELEVFRKSNYKKFNPASKILSFLYVHHSRLNRHFLRGSFEDGLKAVPRTLRRIKRYKSKLDPHRILLLYYKISWMYMGSNRADLAVDYLNEIISQKFGNLREDIQGYSRLMFLMAHYDLENYDLLIYLVAQVDSYFKKMKEKNEVQFAIIKFFKSVKNVPYGEHPDHLKKLKKQLIGLRGIPFTKRALDYLDVMAWVDAKLLKVSISDVVSSRTHNKEYVAQ